MKTTRMVLLAVLVAGLMVPVWALQQKPAAKEMSPQDKQMMDMMEKYGAPVKEHEFLKKFAGEWMVEVRSWAKPGDQPMTSTGTIKGRLLYDGRYVTCHFNGTMMGKPYMGMEIIGYDKLEKKYRTFWIDNMGTGFSLTEGTVDAAGMVKTDTGMMPDPMMGGMQKVKEVTTFMPDGTYKFEMFMVGSDGKEFKSMEFVAKKKM